MISIPRLSRISIPPLLARIGPSLFIFSLILEWSSGYKNAVVGLTTLFLLWQVLSGKRKGQAGGLIVPILFLLAVFLVSAWFAADRAFSMRKFWKFPELLAGYLVLVNLLPSGRRVERAVDGWIWGMGGVALVDFARLALAAFRGETLLQAGRWFGSILGFPTIAAGLYATTLVLAASGWMGEKSPRLRWIRAAEAAGFCALLYLLQTRSVLLGLGIGLVPVALLSVERGRRKALGAAMVAGVVAILLVPGSFRERILQGSLSGRANLWSDTRMTLALMQRKEPARKWIGYGYGHTVFERFYRMLPRAHRTADRIYDHAHNLFLEARVQSGLLGVMAWSGLLLAAGARAVRRFPSRARPERRQVAAGLAGGMLCLLIYGQFSVFHALQPILLFWSLLAALMAACTASDDLYRPEQTS